MYQIGPNSIIVRESDGAHIPPVEGNADYQAYLVWVEEGNAAQAVEDAPLTLEQTDAARSAAYRQESDPIFFKWQRCEASKDEWLASIEEIKSRYPKVSS